jgi:hypothetical protein
MHVNFMSSDSERRSAAPPLTTRGITSPAAMRHCLLVLFDADDTARDTRAGMTRGLRVSMAAAAEVIFVRVTGEKGQRLGMNSN